MIAELNSKMKDSTTLFLEQLTIDFPCISSEKMNELKDLDLTLDVLSRLVQIFNSEFSNRLPEMQNFIMTNDFESLAKTTHRFKSTAYNLGASRAAEITKRIDSMIAKCSGKNSGNKGELNHLLSALEQECIAAYSVLLSYLK